MCDPVYLDESSLTVPSLGLKQVRLELVRLGEEVAEVVRRSAAVIATGSIEEFNRLLDRDKEANQLACAILQYIGRLSQVEHSEGDGQHLVWLAQVVTSLENISDIVGINLLSISQERLTQRIDLARLNDVATSRLAAIVIRSLRQAIRTIGEPDACLTSKVMDAKPAIKALVTTAQNDVLGNLQLADKTQVLGYQPAVDLIQQYRQIAQHSRVIARVMEDVRKL
jgi:phosphate:Na+ symporter